MKLKRRKPTAKPETIAKYSRTTKAPYHCKECNYTSDDVAAVVMHTNRVHNRSVQWNQNGSRKPRKNKLALAMQRESEASPVVIAGTNGRGRPRKVMPEADHWRFCPRCGVDIDLASRAYAVVKSTES